jgi:phosphatidylglycerol---prolipoprotein diacylglyceryl transferase
MLIHPQIDPVAIALGPIAIHWYGLTYLAAFALFVGLGYLRLKHEPYAAQVVLGSWSKQDIEDILFYGVMGVVLGGRIGYCVFYNPNYYLEHPFEVFAVWQGGMSFHGGMLGVCVATAVFAWQRHRPWLWVTDFIAPALEHGVSAKRQPDSPSSFADLPILGRRYFVVYRLVALRTSTTRPRGCVGCVHDGLWQLALYG